jgi:hypothetical protein
MAAADVNGDTSVASVSLSCTRAVTVKIRAIANTADPTSLVPVRGDGSITSRLTINGADGAIGASVYVANSTTVTLTSMLQAGVPTAGLLQGNAVLVVDVP